MLRQRGHKLAIGTRARPQAPRAGRAWHAAVANISGRSRRVHRVRRRHHHRSRHGSHHHRCVRRGWPCCLRWCASGRAGCRRAWTGAQAWDGRTGCPGGRRHVAGGGRRSRLRAAGARPGCVHCRHGRHVRRRCGHGPGSGLPGLGHCCVGRPVPGVDLGWCARRVHHPRHRPSRRALSGPSWWCGCAPSFPGAPPWRRPA